ncbi:MAG: FeoB-associated Cys-rich membrane protein [Clostridia bacterium]|nr:FeoB-associated Cys-rich membrane protein [Clostridia bacterium]
MGAGEIIAIAAIALVIGGAVFYIIKAKKSGRKCIGCPEGCSCGAKKGKEQSKDGESECCCCHKDN